MVHSALRSACTDTTVRSFIPERVWHNCEVGMVRHVNVRTPAQAKNQGTSAKSMSKMHSWPPMEQDIERPMSDLEPVFSAPVLPWGAGLTRTLCPVPGEDPVPRPAAAAKPCCFFEAPVGPADLETQRQAEELRRVLRAMYKTHFQMETNIWCACMSLPSPLATCALLGAHYSQSQSPLESTMKHFMVPSQDC